MFKELILAIIIGAILGLGLTGGYMTMQHKNETPKKDQVIVEPTLIPTTTDQQPSTSNKSEEKTDTIKITSPEDNALLTSDKTSISGTTSKNSNIVITTPSNSFIGKSDESGNFKIAVTLDSGLNTVKITSIDADNNQKDTSINITYSTAKI
jgi:hypothetical protein